MNTADHFQRATSGDRLHRWLRAWWIVAGLFAASTVCAVVVGAGRGPTAVVLGLAAACLLLAARLWLDGRRQAIAATPRVRRRSGSADTIDPYESSPLSGHRTPALASSPMSQRSALARLLKERTGHEPTWALLVVDAPNAAAGVRKLLRDAIPGAEVASPLSSLVSVVLDDGAVLVATTDRDLTFGCAWLAEHVAARMAHGGDRVRIGAALFPGDGVDLERLVEAARAAAGRGNQAVTFHDPTTLDRLVLARELASETRRAIHQREVVAHYQPILDAHTLAVVGIEAFARWNHPYRGVLDAKDFVGAVATSGAGLDLGAHVFADACARMPRWRQRYAPALYAAVNTTASQLRDAHSLDLLIGTLERASLPPSAIRLEVPAQDLLSVQRADPVTLGRLLALGVEIWVDASAWDEETFHALAHPAVRGLKLPASALDEDVAHRFTTLHHRRGWKLAVKNVETHDQLKLARGLAGISSAQGRLMCEPLEPGMVRQFLSRNGPRTQSAHAP